jgi:hypothetical protein
MKYTVALISLFLIYHKTIDALNPWWRLLIFPILIITVIYRSKIDKGLKIILSKPKALKILTIILVLLFTFRMAKSIYNIARPLKAIEDISVVHEQAIDYLFVKKENPYKHILFEQSPIIIKRNGKTDTYSGFIYTPLGIIYYAPFIQWLGRKGMYLGNFFAYWGLFALLLVFLRRKEQGHLLLGSLFFLSIDYVFTKSFNRGTNDFIPALLMLLSIFFLDQKKNSLAGIALGTSLGFKQYPGAILSFILFFNKKYKALAAASIVFGLIIMPFAINDFTSLYRQIFEVFLYAPIGNTILKDLPEITRWPISLIAVVFMGYFSLRKNSYTDWDKIFFPFILFVVFTKSSFTTYFICLFPISIFWFLNIPRHINEK